VTSTGADRSPDRWEQALARAGHAPRRPGNRLTLLRDGVQTYDQWLDRIGNAQRWVHCENYFFMADDVGRRFATALSEKALVARFPRLLAWPLAALGAAAGTAQVRRALHRRAVDDGG
jgi:phosphatidylserine/phosphatidylglycerophosphate/cardiolipin synthase-like enzyme